MRLINLQTFQVKRAGTGVAEKGYYDDVGNYVDADQSTDSFSITGNLQPIIGKDISLVPDGFKRTDTRVIYTKTELRTVNEDLGTEADNVVLPDGDYQVQAVEPWIGRRLSHYKVIIVKKEKQ